MDAITARGRFQAAPGTLPDGSEGPLLIDANGRLEITTSSGGILVVEFNPPTTYNSIDTGGLLSSDVVLAAPATFLDVNGFNASADTRFFQLYDTIAVPLDGVTPATIPIQVPPGSHFSYSPAVGQGQIFSVGITWASSTTQLTKTESGAADMIIEIGFRP